MPVAEDEMLLEGMVTELSDSAGRIEIDEKSGHGAAGDGEKKSIVGIIYPPPEVRNIVDKTATFVARNGPDFETRIRQNEQNNPKFNFLNAGDPYHAYYQHKVKEIQEGKPSGPEITSAATQAQQEIILQKSLPTAQQLIDEAKKKKQKELLSQVELPFVPRDPPSDFEFVADPPSISAIDLDIVKLTAQFVARNGRQFLSSLMTREQRNYQFDFLRPQHSLFQYFTKLLEQYTKVLIPPKDIVKKLSVEEKKKILNDVKYRSNWIKHQEAVKRKDEEAAERERMAYASIDWHDFVVVETVDYQPFESGHFPPPTTPQEVGARVLLQDRIILGEVHDRDQQERDQGMTAMDDTEVQDMEEDSSSSEDEEQEKLRDQGEKEPMPGLPSAEPPREDRVIIKKNYDPKQAKAPQEKVLRPMPGSGYTISPITGERIAVSKVAEHFRIGLLDPRWKEQRDRQLIDKANQESVYAPGVAIDESLKLLAERRSDIFGMGVEETRIGQKMSDEPREARWDPSIDIVPRTIISAPNIDEKPDDKKDTIGPSKGPHVISSGPQPPQPPPPQSAPPPNPGPPPLPPLPGIIRSVPGGPPHPHPGHPHHQHHPHPPPGVMMPGRPLLPPGFPPPGMSPGMPPFNPGHSGHPGSISRPPLITTGGPGSIIAPPQPPGMLLPPQQQQQQQQQPPDADEPASKKTKTLEDSLIPESQFLGSNPSPSTFSVALPVVGDKPEMNLHGQLLSITLPLEDPVATLKQKINEQIGLAPSKQKLRTIEGLFFKDSNSLAFYNVGNGAIVHLSLKERGGRKK